MDLRDGSKAALERLARVLESAPTITAAAAELGVSRQTLCRWGQRGELREIPGVADLLDASGKRVPTRRPKCLGESK